MLKTQNLRHKYHFPIKSNVNFILKLIVFYHKIKPALDYTYSMNFENFTLSFDK